MLHKTSQLTHLPFYAPLRHQHACVTVGNQAAHTFNTLDTLPSVHRGCALGHGCKLGPGNQAAHTFNTLDTLPSVHWGRALGHGCKLGPGNQTAHTLNTLDILPSVHRGRALGHGCKLGLSAGMPIK